MTASACQPSRRGGRIRRIAADQLAAEGIAGGRVAVESQTNELRDQLLEGAALLQSPLLGLANQVIGKVQRRLHGSETDLSNLSGKPVSQQDGSLAKVAWG